MIGLIVVILLTLFFFFVTYMTTKTWRGWHVALLFGVFLFALLFTGLSAMSLKTRQGWKKQYDDLQANLKTEQQKLERLNYGALLTDEEVASIPGLEGELERTILDRARVWRSVIPAGVAEAGVVLNMTNWGDARCFGTDDTDEPLTPQPDPNADPAAAPAPPATHGLTPDMVVYAFLEGNPKNDPPQRQQALFGESDLLSDAEGDQVNRICQVPIYYLGNFRITASEGNQVVVTPILPPTEQQMQAIQAQQNTWVLYEVMPIDTHTAFEGLTPEQLQTLFPTHPELNEIVEEYARDLQPAEGNPEDARTLRLVKFLEATEFDVDVDGEREGLENFDPSGRAVAAHLKQGEPTTFNAGDTFYFDSATALRLESEGKVQIESESPIYVRQLRDYEYFFYEKNGQVQQLQAKMGTIQAENDAIAGSAEKARQQIAYREQEIEKLNEDNAQLKAELAMLKQFRAKLKERFENQRSALSSLYNWNLQLADELRGSMFIGDSN